MIYKEVYNRLIDKAKQRECGDGYYETHHIIPRSEGGSNSKDNLVKLIPKEHFVAHKLLFLDNPNSIERISTMWLMSNEHKIQSGRVYEQVRNSFLTKVMGKPKSEEHKKNISKALLGKPKSKESIEKMKANLGDRSGENNANFGKGRSIIGDGIEYKNAREAALANNTTPQNIHYRITSKSDKWSMWYYSDGQSVSRKYNTTKKLKGRKLSDEHIEKIRIGRIGIKHYKDLDN